MEKKLAGVLCLLLFAVFVVNAQPRTLSLEEAEQLGIQNSKQLKRNQYKIDQALARFAQAKDAALPTTKVSFQYLHALMLSRVISIPGVTTEPLKLPFDFPAYLGTLSVNEPIFAGNSSDRRDLIKSCRCQSSISLPQCVDPHTDGYKRKAS